MMAEIPTIQTVICPRCQYLLGADQKCPSCTWQRPSLEEKEGAVAWKLSLDGQFIRPYNTAVVYDDMLISGVLKGKGNEQYTHLVAINLTTGKTDWSLDLTVGYITRFLVLVKNILLVSSENVQTLGKNKNSLLALDPLTGQQKWSYAVKAHSLSAPAVIDNTIFFTTSDRDGHAVELETGKFLWQLTKVADAWSVAPPAVGNNSFYIGGRTATIKAIGINGRPSELFRAKDENDWFDFPLGYNESTLFALCWNKLLYAIDTNSGKLKWSVKVERGASGPLIIGQHLYIPYKENEPRTYGLRALSKNNGSTIWQFNTNRHFEAPACVANTLVFIGGNDGNLYALDMKTGAQKWFVEAQDKIRLTPIVNGNHVCFGTQEGQLFVVRWQQEEPAELLTAEEYRTHKTWISAGTAASLDGKWEEAALDFEKAGRIYEAAQAFERAGSLAKAANLYMKSDHFSEALTLYQQLNDLHGEAEASLAMKQFEHAAKLFSEIGDNERSAIIYNNAGHLNRAAAQYDKAGMFPQAADIYERLNKLESAAKIYEKDQEYDRAVEVWLRLGQPRTAAKMLERARKFGDAAKLLEDEGYVEDAAQIWIRQTQYAKAASIYERSRRWIRAAELYEQANERERAAVFYEQAGEIQKAAKLYLRTLKFSKAADLLLQTDDLHSLAQAYEGQKDWRAAAKLYLSMNPPRFKDAGRCFEKENEWAEAANAYEDGAMLRDAIRCWHKANKFKRAAHLMYQLGHTKEAAEYLEKQGELMEAAEMYLKNDNLNEAVRLYRKMGNEQHALELLAEHGAWTEYRRLATETRQYEQEAEANTTLARKSSPSERVKFLRAAAQSYERAALQYEEESPPGKTIEEAADMWEKAAELYEKIGSNSEEIARCKRQSRRLRGWPQIVIDVKAEKDLVLDEYHALIVTIKNIGYGDAQTISLKVTNDEFDGDIHSTQEIVKLLQPEGEKQIRLRIKPKTSGSAVPLEFLLVYQRPDDSPVVREISTDIQVHRTVSQPITLSDIGEQSPIDIYEDTDFHPDTVYWLTKGIGEYYNMLELQELASFLSIQWENLAGDTRLGKARELVEFMQRRDKLPTLIAKLREDRQSVNWDEMIENQN